MDKPKFLICKLDNERYFLTPLNSKAVNLWTVELFDSVGLGKYLIINRGFITGLK